MTSIAAKNVWTPELIQMDKELKEKYGPNAHVIPMETYGYSALERAPEECDCFEVSTAKNETPEKSNKLLEGLKNLLLFRLLFNHSSNQFLINDALMQSQIANDMAMQAHQQAMDMHNQAVMMTTPGMGII